jgi:uncharacterized membrane protein
VVVVMMMMMMMMMMVMMVVVMMMVMMMVMNKREKELTEIERQTKSLLSSLPGGSVRERYCQGCVPAVYVNVMLMRCSY